MFDIRMMRHLPPPDFGDCSTKCQNVKNKASGQRAPILDVLAFHAFRSLRGAGRKVLPERDARRGRKSPLCKCLRRVWPANRVDEWEVYCPGGKIAKIP